MRVLISDPAEGGSLNCTETTAGLRSRLRSACIGTERRGLLLTEHFVVNVPLIISIDQFAMFADNPLRTFTLLMKNPGRNIVCQPKFMMMDLYFSKTLGSGALRR